MNLDCLELRSMKTNGVLYNDRPKIDRGTQCNSEVTDINYVSRKTTFKVLWSRGRFVGKMSKLNSEMMRSLFKT